MNSPKSELWLAPLALARMSKRRTGDLNRPTSYDRAHVDHWMDTLPVRYGASLTLDGSGCGRVLARIENDDR